MRYRLLLAIPLLALASGAHSNDVDTSPAIRFAQKSFKSAQSPLMRWGIKGDKVEGTGPLRRWSASTCPTASDAPRFEDLPSVLADYCKHNNGRMAEDRCWQTESGREATWFAFRFERLPPCGGNISISGAGKAPTYQLLVAELHPSAVGTPGSDLEWMQAGFKSDQQVLSERRRAVTAAAHTQAFLQQQEQERVAAEAPRLKTKGTQVCKRQNSGTYLGFVEDASGDRIKVLITAHYWGEPGTQRDNNYRGQEYTWSDISEWYPC